jgi:chromosome segregation ATPase
MMNERLKDLRQERNELKEVIDGFEVAPTVAPSNSPGVGIAELRTELNAMANQLNSRDKALADEKSRHDSTRRRLEQSLESLRRASTDPTERRLRTEMNALQLALANAERRAGITSKERSELNYLRSRVTGLQSQLAAARNSDAELNRFRDQLRMTRAELVEAKAEEGKALVRANNLRDKVTSLEGTLSQKYREISGLQADNTRLRSNQVSSRQLVELRAELAAMKSELLSATSKVSNKSSKISSLQQDLSALQKALVAAERRADALAEDVQKLRHENRNLRDRLDIRQAAR